MMSYTCSIRHGIITYISPVIKRMSHYSLEDLIGKSFKDIVHPDDVPAIALRLLRTLNGEVEPFEFRVLDRDGSVLHVRTSSRVNIENGAVVGLTGLMIDITERKTMEEAILESENRYRTIFDESLNMVYIHDFKGKFIDANDAALDFLGYDRADIPAITLKDLVSEEEQECAVGQLTAIFRDGKQNGTLEYTS